MRRAAALATLTLCLAFAGCDSGAFTTCQRDDDCPADRVCQRASGRCVAGHRSDGGTPPARDARGDGPRCTVGLPCGSRCCARGDVCQAGRCLRPQGPCKTDDDCRDDTYCDRGRCVPWGSGPRGASDKRCALKVTPGLFSPVRQCAWTAPPKGDAHPGHRNVLGTPIVVDFDFDGKRSDRKPSIVFVSYNGDDGDSRASDCTSATYYGVVRVIDGKTCRQQFSLAMARVRASSPLAAGDLDGDGTAEIVASRCGGGLVAFRYDRKARTFKLHWTSSPATTGARGGGWSGPAIHDLDDDGKPEVLLWGTVWSRAGKLLDGSLGQLPYSAGSFPVAADLDGDKLVELTDGHAIWEWKAGRWRAQTTTRQPAGHTALADFGTYGGDPKKDDRGKLDGVPEIAVVSSGRVRVQTLAGRVVFGPVAIPAGGTGGPPTIGDFDRDGRAEVAAAGRNSYSVFDPDCRRGGTRATCASGATAGVLWTRSSQDFSSNVTGSSVFDFDGDGAAEAVYADECFTRIYDGKSGRVVYSQARSSCTWNENPIVADVDGDFNAELVVPSNTNCATVDLSCKTNPLHPRHKGGVLDPLFPGLPCKVAADCPGGGCDAGLCRCTSDAQCGGRGFVCAAPVRGSAGKGNVCRAAYTGPQAGVLVYRDALDRWVRSRTIWNQHTYSVTNVEEDGRIPRTSAWKPNWKQPGLNNYRQNVQGTLAPRAAPDLTARRETQFTCDKQGNLTLVARICNRGSQPVGAGLPVSFYRGVPAPGTLICTGRTAARLDPGACQAVRCVWKKAPSRGGVDVTVVADDDGTGRGTSRECREGNNRTVLPGVRCRLVK